MHVLHHCDNPPCRKLSHLFLGTPADNAADRDAKGRQARGETNARTKLTPSDVREIRALAAVATRHSRTDSISSIARRFPVSRTQIDDIIAGKSWVWVV
jgi:hypothetical protein